MYLLYTAGEPAGIGPDLAILLASQQQVYPIVVIADQHLLVERANSLNCSIEVVCVNSYDKLNIDVHYTGNGQLLCLHIDLINPVKLGVLDHNNSPYVLNCLDMAIELVMAQHNQFKGIVTGPLHKGVINDYYQSTSVNTDLHFSGHTEYLAEKSNTDKVIMMLACEQLRVALVTTHLPLKDISSHINKDLIFGIIKLLDKELKNKLGLNTPKIYVCGLNPHAGEDGHLGTEEIDEIIPAISDCQSLGINADGPIPADTVFTPHYLDKADVVLAMYHDQGLPVLKHLGFGAGVNITLGLPFIRTSVDHGTALDLAGNKDAINIGSLLYAIQCATEMNGN